MITQQEIFSKYPEIFKRKNKSPQETCMCWGLAVPDQWLPVIDDLCHALQNRGFEMMCSETGNHVSKPQVVAEQVKEKFGQLRFYYDLEFDSKVGKETYFQYVGYYDGMIAFAEDMIAVIDKDKKKWNETTEEYLKRIDKPIECINTYPIQKVARGGGFCLKSLEK